MGMGFAPTWLCQVSPTPASHDHFNYWRRLKNSTSQTIVRRKTLRGIKAQRCVRSVLIWGRGVACTPRGSAIGERRTPWRVGRRGPASSAPTTLGLMDRHEHTDADMYRSEAKKHGSTASNQLN